MLSLGYFDPPNSNSTFFFAVVLYVNFINWSTIYTSLTPENPERMTKKYDWTISHHGQDDQSRKYPHGHICQQLYDLVPVQGRKVDVFFFRFKRQPSVCCKHLWPEFGFRLIMLNRDTRRHKDRLCYLSWKKKTYMDPTHAMTQISQRMWHAQGPSSLSINLEKKGQSHMSVQFQHVYHCCPALDRSPPSSWPTRGNRRRRWRSRWPSGHTCGTAAPPSCRHRVNRCIRNK